MAGDTLRSEFADVVFSATVHDEDGTQNLVVWTNADHNAAIDQGWFLDHGDGAIQADLDSDRFEDHTAAFEHVRQLASQGDERMIRAMVLDAHSTMQAWLGNLMDSRDVGD